MAIHPECGHDVILAKKSTTCPACGKPFNKKCWHCGNTIDTTTTTIHRPCGEYICNKCLVCYNTCPRSTGKHHA